MVVAVVAFLLLVSIVGGGLLGGAALGGGTHRRRDHDGGFPAQPTSPVQPPWSATAPVQPPAPAAQRVPQLASMPQRGPERAPPSRSLAPHSQTATLAECWLPPGTRAQIGPWEIPGGMLYVLRDPARRVVDDEASLIDPRVPVAAPGGREQRAAMPYWPRYAQIAPAARTEYLRWLAGGRRDPDVQLGCVFLFFYGLERRVLVDAARAPEARAEVPAIVAELDRLLPIYGDSASFAGYAGRLRAVASVFYLGDRAFESLTSWDGPPTYADVEAIALRLSLELARTVRDRRPINADLALVWYLASQLPLRTPAQRCWPEFLDLFRERYAARMGGGLVIEPNRTRLRIAYVPASPSLAGIASDLEPPDGPLPDVMRLTRPLRKIADVVSACTDELDAYSRWLGRNSGSGGTLRALALLPPSLVSRQRGSALDGLRRMLEEAFGAGSRAVIAVERLFEHWPPDKGTKMSKKDATLFAQLLDKIGIGIEPDVRFGGPTLETGAKAVVFRTADGPAALPSTSYQGAAVLLHVAAAVASADGDVAGDEQTAIQAQLHSIKALGPSERTRLAAHVEWLFASGVSLRGIQKRLDTLDARARRSIATFAVAVAGADGRVDRREVKTLEKIYAALGLTSNELFDDLHAMTSVGTAPAAEPVVVRPGKRADGGFRGPAAPKSDRAPAGAVELDMALVRAKLAETAAVSELLAGIFVEDDDPRGDETEAPELTEAAPVGALPEPGALDATHRTFVKSLATKASWALEELDAIARAQGLLLDGALDVINEAALDRTGEPAVEGTDPLDVNMQVVEELLR